MVAEIEMKGDRVSRVGDRPGYGLSRPHAAPVI